jgi:hypothetical protein
LQVESDGARSNAQKTKVATHYCAISEILFCSNAGTTVSSTIGGKSGKVDGRLG